MKTFSLRKEDTVNDWYLVNAAGLTLGRLASTIAIRLRGKHKSEYTPHVDTGDNIVVINASKIKVTGNKEQGKMYHRHTGYPGGLKSVSLGDMRKKNSPNIIKLAVKGMLPRGSLGSSMFAKLKVYSDDVHPHAAQQPQELKL